MRIFFQNLIYLVEFLLLKIIFFLLNIFPISFVSKFGGILFMTFGQLTNSHKTAIQNCTQVFQNMENKKIKKIVLKSWENLGRTIFELIKLKKITANKNNINISGLQNIDKIIKNKIPAIYFGIHQSNWEICVPLLDKMDIKVGAIYRHINNALVDQFVLNQRNLALTTNFSFYTPKGKKSAKDVIENVKKNNSVFLLIDQKDSAGEEIIFFNKPIKTQTGFLKIARKYKIPIVPMENKRLGNGKFLINFHKPFYNNQVEISDKDMMIKIHKIIEKWILENPQQWLWQHNRFN